MPSFYGMSMRGRLDFMMDSYNEPPIVKPPRKLAVLLLTFLFILTVTGKYVDLHLIFTLNIK